MRSIALWQMNPLKLSNLYQNLTTSYSLQVTFEHVLRKDNSVADSLANDAIGGYADMQVQLDLYSTPPVYEEFY